MVRGRGNKSGYETISNILGIFPALVLVIAFVFFLAGILLTVTAVGAPSGLV